MRAVRSSTNRPRTASKINLPLAKRNVTLTIEGEPPFEGQTDANGLFEKAGVPAGDLLARSDQSG